MAPVIEELRPSASKKFEIAQHILLLNEDIRFVCQTQKGFLVISSRRVSVLNEDSKSGYHIVQTLPNDCIIGFESKKSDRVEISCGVLDQFGHQTDEIRTIEIRAPQGNSGDNKTEVRSHFQSTISRVEEHMNITTRPRDFSYLESMPESLTQNAILDLNTILRDQPVHDELVYEALKFLGSEPFLLEESLRDGDDRENGVLFAAGKNGYFWIQGKKRGRFMSNVIIDTVEWDNIGGIAHQWHKEPALINVVYSLVTDGKAFSKEYQWSPPVNTDTLKFPWLLQPRNGPYIFEDVVLKYSGKSVPTTFH
ncbi:MAG: hypothetical protein E4H14_11180 [Candidatus Thorarchaeota archaeon]|nr:MAG: hypothetical protein E4H14_11180 [Candidatus Thorarchaeota archaeon]